MLVFPDQDAQERRALLLPLACPLFIPKNIELEEKMYIAKRRNGWYKYQSYYENGKRKQQYLGKANLIDRIIYAIKKRFR